MDDAYKDMYVTVDKKKYRALVQERDRLVTENTVLRDQLKKAESRLSDAYWTLYPDRMGR